MKQNGLTITLQFSGSPPANGSLHLTATLATNTPGLVAARFALAITTLGDTDASLLATLRSILLNTSLDM